MQNYFGARPRIHAHTVNQYGRYVGTSQTSKYINPPADNKIALGIMLS